jgi:sorbitol-specific phosphotransferase system component IIC
VYVPVTETLSLKNALAANTYGGLVAEKAKDPLTASAVYTTCPLASLIWNVTDPPLFVDQDPWTELPSGTVSEAPPTDRSPVLKFSEKL